MKNYWKVLLMAAGIGIFAACEDVPEPYNIPSDNATPSVPSADYILNQSFTSSLGEFTSQSESGSLKWTSSSKYGAIITGYDDWEGTGTKSNLPGVTYLISPAIDLTTTDSAYVVIEQAINYAKTTLEEDHALLIRVGEGTWSALPMSLSGLGSSFTYQTQNIQLPQEYIGQNIQLALKHIAHDSYSSTWEVKSLKVAKGQAPAANSGETPTFEDGVGSGTKDDPYDVPTTIKLIAAGPPSTKIYTKGIVSQIDEINESFGNATYYISNDGTTTDQLEVYRGFGLGGEKFKADGLKVGDEVIVYGQVIYYNNKTMEFTQGSEIYSLNGVTAGGGGETGEAKGSGTLEDPFNSVKANEVASALASGAESDKDYYIKGKVVSIATDKNGVAQNYDAGFGNASFYISDDGKEAGQFYVYRALYLGNKEYTSGDILKVGDEVIICGRLTNYNGKTPETVQKKAYLYSLNGKTEAGGGDTPDPTPGEAKGSGTLADPFNAVAATQKAGELSTGETSSESYYIKGKISQIKYTFSADYGTATFHISEDGSKSNEFYIYSTLFLGNKSWTTGNTQIKVGDEVVVYGQLTNYNGTLETASKKSYIYSLNGKTEDDGQGGGDNPDPQPSTNGIKLADFTNGGFESWTDGVPDLWQSTTTASTKNTVSQSTDARTGSYSVQVAGTTSGNNRLASTELALEAGEYTMQFFVKPEADGGSVRPGFVPVTDGKVGSYVYGDYTNDIPAGTWTEVTHTFTLSAATTVNLVIMNPKKPGKNFLIDDFTITKK